MMTFEEIAVVLNAMPIGTSITFPKDCSADTNLYSHVVTAITQGTSRPTCVYTVIHNGVTIDVHKDKSRFSYLTIDAETRSERVYSFPTESEAKAFKHRYTVLQQELNNFLNSFKYNYTTMRGDN